jgi:Asp-tRNA(Asn)/Glu-tRNA(Gln) amidotransferase A subunit family amidase|tara:strand:- start:67 stop:1437 length:1371 start_codon:yes stop_codon:yes gene_type:complete
MSMQQSYDPLNNKLLTFHDHVPKFISGEDTPSAYLERCLKNISKNEPKIKAFVTMNIEGARAAAKSSTNRYAENKVLSSIDGMPFGIKDVFETKDMATECGSPIFKDNKTGRDAALVSALRKAGAIILGKTVTTEFAFYKAGPTRNPYDLERTPGGSSSGSGAAVGAGFLPISIGTQVVGSLIRPSSYNANFGFKPSFGAINREGAYSNLSQSVLGTQAGSLTDAWIGARVAAEFAGGDLGYAGLKGPITIPKSEKPLCLGRLETAGWDKCSPEVKAKFNQIVTTIASKNVKILDRDMNPKLDSYENLMLGAFDTTMDICGYEFLWPLKDYEALGNDLISSDITSRLRDWEKINRDVYETQLKVRDTMRASHHEFFGEVDAFITLSAPDCAPEGLTSTGDPSFAVNSSILGVPAINLPLLEVNGMPLGVQIIGYSQNDAKLFSIAHWLTDLFQLNQ